MAKILNVFWSGYIQKKIVKKIEDCSVWDDGTVRDVNDSIVQFMYGGDGMEAKHLIYCRGVEYPIFCDPYMIASLLNTEAEYAIEKGDKMGTLRTMTKSEIEALCSFIKSGCPGVQTEVTERTTFNTRTLLRSVLPNVEIYESMIPRFCSNIRDDYEGGKAKKGYMAGLIAASSTGEITTQLTLNSFHSTGMSAKDVTLGVPRLKELLNVTKNPSRPGCSVYLIDEELKTYEENVKNNIDKEINEKKSIERVTHIANKLVDLNVDYFVKKYELRYLLLPKEKLIDKTSPVNLMDFQKYEKRWWVKLAEDLGNAPTVEPDSWVIILELDLDKLYRYGITPKKIARKIEKEAVETMGCLPSPTNIAQIEVYLNFKDIRHFIGDKFSDQINEGEPDPDEKKLITYDNIDYFTTREVAIELIKKTRVQGVSGITKTFIRQDLKTKEWLIDTQGTNLSEILARPEVDQTRTMSDDLWEVYNVLGLEAARILLIEETIKILSFDGTYVNPRHITILADSMCKNAILTGANRDGISRDVGPIAKGMFEKAVDNFAEAAAFGEFDDMKGVAASVMYGTLPKVGTGTVEIKDSEKMPVEKKPVKIPIKKRGIVK